MKKITSILLALVMTLTMLPTAVWATGSTANAENIVASVYAVGDDTALSSHATLQEAVDSAKSGQTVKLLNNVDLSSYLKSDKTYTLDLNGFALTRERLVLEQSSGVLTIVDSSPAGTGKIESAKTSALELTTNSRAKIELRSGTVRTYSPISVNNTTTLCVSGGKIVGTDDQYDTYVLNMYGATLEVSGGVISGANRKVINASSSDITISGGKVESTAASGLAVIYAADSTLEVTGGEIMSTGTYGIDIAGNSTLTVTAGKFENDTSAVQVEGGTAYIKGGTYKVSPATSTNDCRYLLNCIDDAYRAGTAKIEVTGGTFHDFDPTNNLAEGTSTNFVPGGYKSERNQDGTYSLIGTPIEYWTGFSANAKTKSFATLDEALTYAQGATDVKRRVVVAGDYTLTKDISVPEATYLDVLGTLTIPAGVTVTVPANAKRLGAWDGGTICGEGKVLVEGRGSLNGESYVMINGTMSIDMLTPPAGYMLDKNGNSYFAAKALYELTFKDGSTKLTADRSNITADTTQVKLLDDITVGSWTISTNSVAEGFALDLNGYTLNGSDTSSYYVLYIGTTMTIKNGTVKYNASNQKGAICAFSSGEVTIAADAVIDGGNSLGVMMQDTPKLVVNGTVKTTGEYAIAGNGSENTDKSVDSVDITINTGAKVEAPNGFGIYHPQLGTVTINGGEISGHTGVEMCAGKLIISGGSITSTGANWDATGSQNAILDGGAISIIDRNYPGGTPSAEISGGVIKANGTNALAIKAYDYRNDVVADWTDAPAHIVVTGGTYSSDPTEYVDTQTYVVITNNDNTWTVTKRAAQEAPTGLTAVNETIKGKKDGKITGVTTAMEYRKDCETAYIAITGDVLENLAVGKYYVRYKETNTSYAGADAVLEIKAGKALAVTFNTLGGDAKAPVSGLSYNDALAAGAATRSGYDFRGWFTDPACTHAWNAGDKVTADVTLYAKWLKTAQPGVAVKTETEVDAAGKNLVETSTEISSDATGSTEVKTEVTIDIASGKITGAVETVTKVDTKTGVTNKVETKKDADNKVIETTRTEITESTEGGKKIVATVEIKNDAAITVDGLHDAAKAEDAQSTVELTLTVKHEAASDASAAQASIRKLQVNSKETLNFLTVDLEKWVDGVLVSDAKDGNETKKVVAIKVDFVTANRVINVYREHDGAAAKLKETNSTAKMENGTFFVGDGYVIIYTSQFSTYAIGSAEKTSSGGGHYYPSAPTITAVLTSKDSKSATDYTSGIYGLTFRTTGSYSSFTGVQVDGKTLDKSNYIVESTGTGTEIYLKAAYLKTLKDGRHTVTVLSSEGNASMDFTIGGKNSSPATSDAGVGLYVALAVLSVTGIAWVYKKRSY